MSTTRVPVFLLLAALTAVSAISQQTGESPSNQAIRLNNLGAAYMNQQKVADALQAFERAISLDPSLIRARINHAIALFNNQQVERSRDVLLELTAKYPSEYRAWYNLGIAYKSLGQTELAIDAFSRVAQLRPDDADTHYHLGSMYAQAQKYPQAIAAFEQALALSPYHVSAEFGMARSYQRMNDSPKAQEHLARFQRFTQERLGTPMGLGYGEQGVLSVAGFVSGNEVAGPPVSVRFVSVASQAGLNFSHSADGGASSMGSGACFFDYDNDDRQDLLLLGGGSGGPARLFRNQGNGRFADATSSARLSIKGYGMACSAADYDNDGRIDVAMTLLDSFVLLRNNNGTFDDVTADAGVQTAASPLGVNFIDYDHDGDVDIYVGRFGNSGNVLWRNNGDGKFTDVTAATALGGNTPSIGSTGTDLN
ncbi:MAG: VCBS repeat-containing protein, partial [Acidobacteria bacterium]|nr:VCBS repeat-containing protein [Acidobacteriota bacterium]